MSRPNQFITDTVNCTYTLINDIKKLKVGDRVIISCNFSWRVAQGTVVKKEPKSNHLFHITHDPDFIHPDMGLSDRNESYWYYSCRTDRVYLITPKECPPIKISNIDLGCEEE